MRGVLGVFSAELPFNGAEGVAMAHKDAVHIGDWHVFRIIGEMIVDRLCHGVGVGRIAF